MRSVLIGAVAGLFIAGCAVTVDVPANRFDSPETLGKQWRVKVQGDYGGSNSVELTPLLSSSVPNTASPKFETTRFVRASGGVELFQNFDAELVLARIFVIANEVKRSRGMKVTVAQGIRDVLFH